MSSGVALATFGYIAPVIANGGGVTIPTDPISATAGEVCYLPEREQVYWYRDDEILMYDIRADQWSAWTMAEDSGDTLGTTMCTAAGVLWSCGHEPMKFTAQTGQDTHDVNADITQELEIGNINVAGPLRWARLKSLRVLGDFTSQYALNQSVQLDDATTLSATELLVNTATVTTWPTSRHSPEWRLPQQKCSTVSVTISAAPAVATWTALEFEVLTQGHSAPSRQRQ